MPTTPSSTGMPVTQASNIHNPTKKSRNKSGKFDYAGIKKALKDVIVFNFRNTKHFTPSQKSQIRKAFRIFIRNHNATWVKIPKTSKKNLSAIRKKWNLGGTQLKSVPIYRPPSAHYRLDKKGVLTIIPKNAPLAREKIIPFPVHEYVSILDFDERRLFVEQWVLNNFDIKFGGFDTLTIYNAHYAPMQSRPSFRMDDKESINYISEYFESKDDKYLLATVFAISLYKGEP